MATSQPISPVELAKKHPTPIQPNAHPYAVKTTSSALLSRSSSSPHTAHYARHHYIPSPPSRVPTGTRVRHRHSSSLSSVEGVMCNANGWHTMPAPLPIPSPAVVAPQDNASVSLKRVDGSKRSHRVWGLEAVPSSATVTENYGYDQKHGFGHDQDSSLESYAGLPPNPRRWNTEELSTYLETSIKLGNNTNEDKDDPSIMDILECVRTRGLTGRELLRLTDADLADTPLSNVQRAQLLECSRALRADVLRGRIYVDSFHSHEISDDSSNNYFQSTGPSTTYQNVRGASLSVDDLRLLLDNDTGKGESVLSPSPITSLHRSNSVSEASAQRYRDLARMRIRRRGKVKGLVESWERASTSGSECSTSEAESESGTDPENEPISEAKRSPGLLSDLPSALHDEPPHDVCPSVMDLVVAPQESPLSPPSYTHIHSALISRGDEEEEPSIEELLASSSNTPLRGARAWEADFALETVKRVPISASVDAGSPSASVTELGAPHHLLDHGRRTEENYVWSRGPEARRSTGNRGKDAKIQKRVVTAIFTGSLSNNVYENVGDEGHLGDTLTSSDPQDDPDNALRALEKSIEDTRAQLEALRVRLENIEADTARQEVVLMQVQSTNSPHSSEFELRQRRSEALEQTMTGTVKPPKDETFVGGTRNTDTLDGWGNVSLADIVHTIVARTMRWLVPYEHLGVRVPEDHDESQARTGPLPEDDRCRPLTKRNRRLPLLRMSYSLILVSFAVCAAVLRRLGFGRWVRRP